MAEESSGQDKSEAPTERRLQEARRKGDVPKSQEIPSVAVLLAGLLALYFGGGFMLERFMLVMRHYLGNVCTFEIVPANLTRLTGDSLLQTAVLLGPVMAVILLAALAANYAQVGVLFASEKLQPNFSKIDPIQGVGNLFSKQMLANTVKSVAKLLIIGYVAYAEVKKSLPLLPQLMAQEPNQILLFMASAAFWLFLKAALIIAVLALLDYGFQRWQFMDKMKMTKQELKEEAKMTEGDPQVKGRIRSIQMEMARKRMMAEVPKADVVITNPTRLAIALRYEPLKMNAPTVVAKGAGVIAQKIKEIAREHQVPLVENKPLAQALYKMVDLNEAVPENLFQAVAEVLAYVYSLKRKTA
ncbi:MAG: flagellar biosynthesis protein FlhB [Desulfobacteraceae bacterium]|nr:flagellar biosynthesis protein FlhB [Desulfobacteraceae bacterium]